jgi:hypothetical protein
MKGWWRCFFLLVRNEDEGRAWSLRWKQREGFKNNMKGQIINKDEL